MLGVYSMTNVTYLLFLDHHWDDVCCSKSWGFLQATSSHMGWPLMCHDVCRQDSRSLVQWMAYISLIDLWSFLVGCLDCTPRWSNSRDNGFCHVYVPAFAAPLLMASWRSA